MIKIDGTPVVSMAVITDLIHIGHLVLQLGSRVKLMVLMSNRPDRTEHLVTIEAVHRSLAKVH